VQKIIKVLLINQITQYNLQQEQCTNIFS
jgi:hypothetical protein